MPDVKTISMYIQFTLTEDDLVCLLCCADVVLEGLKRSKVEELVRQELWVSGLPEELEKYDFGSEQINRARAIVRNRWPEVSNA